MVKGYYHNKTSEIAPADLEDGQILGQCLTSVMSPTGERVQITKVDEAMKYLPTESKAYSEEAYKKLVRKIDLYLCPLMCLVYAVQFMDKASTSYAAIMGLRTGLKMIGNMYSWTATGFYLGYLAFVFPASRLLQRFPVSKTVSVFIVLWGFILCMHAVPENYAGFEALRVILGMLEAAVTPAFVIITSQWYKKEEQFLRTAIWFSFNGFGTILGSSIAYGLAKNGAGYSIKSWKLLFIITGLMTIVLGITILFHIPDYPTNAWFLTEDEKVMVVERIRSNNQGFGNKSFKWDQFREALTDVKTWIYFIVAVTTNIPNGGITNFTSILMNTTFGFGSLKSLLMGMPTGGVNIVGCIGLAYSARYVKHRISVTIFATLLNVMAACLLAWAPSSKAQLAGMYIFGIGPVGMICILSLFASNTAGHTKKIAVNSIYLIGYCVGNLVGPQTFKANQAPEYTGAKLAMVICYIISTFCFCLLYYLYLMDNKRRDQKLVEMGDNYKKIENLEFADLTDKQNPDFRYAL